MSTDTVVDSPPVLFPREIDEEHRATIEAVRTGWWDEIVATAVHEDEQRAEEWGCGFDADLAALVLDELMKAFQYAAKHPGQQYILPLRLDMLLHAMLLYPDEFAAFGALFGGRFVHRPTNDHSGPVDDTMRLAMEADKIELRPLLWTGRIGSPIQFIPNA